MKAQRENTLSLTSVLHWGGWLTPRFGRFTPGKQTLYPLLDKVYLRLVTG